MSVTRKAQSADWAREADRPAREKKRGAEFISVAPNMDTLGIMLPYTPLHHLLLNQTDPILRANPPPGVLVMTSGNLSEEPIATDN
jgi:hydrogenase maturation protein HypF